MDWLVSFTVSVNRNDHINSMNMDKFMVTALAALSIIIAQVFWVTLSCVNSYHILTVFIINLEVYFVLQYCTCQCKAAREAASAFVATP
jgi:hypothetical protein